MANAVISQFVYIWIEDWFKKKKTTKKNYKIAQTLCVTSNLIIKCSFGAKGQKKEELATESAG